MAAGVETGRARRHPWAAWRRWRKGRPFWGGLACVLAGAEICAIPLAPLEIMIHQGIAGIPSVLMGLIMIIMGLTAWFAPQYRALAGILTVLVAAAALVMSNLGGFLIGTLLGIVGGGMIFAWQPLAPASGPGAAPEPAPEPVPDLAPDPAHEPPAAPPRETPSGPVPPVDGKAWPPPPRVPPRPAPPPPDGGVLPPPREPRESA
ncbi:DUF6114 domain-containing protein [Streptomyces albireticuli]|uniref:DUF6114 domain-containing protein n=2 Tax=Streptomyces albireticuli TaxID=1940 RepID=UPI001E3EB873|nr:DUF6114 domain-containing protein [Streptomyces albireticuli]MCD9141945.1 DUF6114 domain-containing protein [Streptomyces albireticuli]MCD9163111.1 DUF6114 domain-containing protein [Streptomyces albireticuli]MCD9190119.1 DUF6114 domain-containing protein [Streptomyces albireticuli]